MSPLKVKVEEVLNLLLTQGKTFEANPKTVTWLERTAIYR